MKKKLRMFTVYSLIIVLMMGLSFPAFALEEGGQPPTKVLAAVETVGTLEELKTALAEVDDGGTIQITADIAVSETLTIPEQKSITITSSKEVKQLKRATDFGKYLFSVGAGKGLTLQNIIFDGSYDAESFVENGLLEVEKGGTLILNSGAVVQNNFCRANGGGVNNYGTFTMKGGTVSNNEAWEGGGVCNWAKFVMQGGSISRNTATRGNGGGILNDSVVIDGAKGSMLMTGGTISENVTLEKAAKGKGIYNSEGGILKFSGTPKMLGDNGVYVRYSSGTPILTGSLTSAAKIQLESIPYFKASGVAIAKGTSSYRISTTAKDKFKVIGGGFTLSRSSSKNQIIAKSTVPIPKITSTQAGKDSVALKWKKVKNAKGYEIYRRTGNSDHEFVKIKDVKSGKTIKCTDKNLDNGQRYYYKIRAYKSVNGNKKYSSFCDGRCAMPGSPKIREIYSLDQTTYQSITMSTWSEYPTAYKASGIEIYRKAPGSNSFEKIYTKKRGKNDNASMHVKFTDTKVKAQKEYIYKARTYKYIKGKKVNGKFSKEFKEKALYSIPRLTAKFDVVEGQESNEVNIAIKSSKYNDDFYIFTDFDAMYYTGKGYALTIKEYSRDGQTYEAVSSEYIKIAPDETVYLRYESGEPFAYAVTDCIQILCSYRIHYVLTGDDELLYIYGNRDKAEYLKWAD